MFSFKILNSLSKYKMLIEVNDRIQDRILICNLYIYKIQVFMNCGKIINHSYKWPFIDIHEYLYKHFYTLSKIFVVLPSTVKNVVVQLLL